MNILKDNGIEIPEWIVQSRLPVYSLECLYQWVMDLIVHGKTDDVWLRGLYAPAVDHGLAHESMAEHGDLILEFLEEESAADLVMPQGKQWTDLNALVVKTAVMLWADILAEQLEQTGKV